jgi:tetratricopeptide (TPR) repeat protein
MANVRADPDRPVGGPDEGQGWRNDLSGAVRGSVVQARSIHGDVVFNMAPDSASPVPRQLLPAPQNFTGRSGELTALRSLLAGTGPTKPVTLAVITGIGGVGKTSLALRWLHDVREDFPAGQLYADLGGHQPDAAQRPEEVLGLFLRALGLRAEQVPARLDEQSAAWRSLTDGRRLAILLDNAASAAQVRTLLPGPGPSLVAITTRWRIGGLAIDGAQFLELGPLDEPDAVELLDRIAGAGRVGREPQAARAVTRLCGHLPLAVCVSGARLAPRPRWPVQRMAEELASEQGRLTALHLTEDMSVRAAFDVAYQALRPELRRGYRLLALVPGPDVGPDLAAAAIAATPDEAAQTLEALAEASLLAETDTQRYRFHDLVRLHARHQAAAEESATERETALARVLDWYLRRAVAADIVISPGRWRLNPMYEQARQDRPAFSDPAGALEYLEVGLPGLIAAVQVAHEQGFHSQAWQLCEALWGVFLYRKHFRSWIDTHAAGLAAARACGSAEPEARMLVQLGYAYYSLRQYPEATEHFSRALTLSRQAGHRLGEATALEHLALVDLRMGRHDQAIDGFFQARVVFQELGRSRGIALMTRHIGEAQLAGGQVAEAIASLRDARESFVSLSDSYMESRTLIGLAQAYLRAGQPETASDLLGHALGIATGLGARQEEARVRVALAEAHAALRAIGQARDHLTAALAIYSEAGAPEAADVRQRIAGLDPEPTGS